MLAVTSAALFALASGTNATQPSLQTRDGDVYLVVPAGSFFLEGTGTHADCPWACTCVCANRVPILGYWKMPVPLTVRTCAPASIRGEP